MTTKQLTADLSQAAGWLTTLSFPSMREHRSRESAIAAIEAAVVLLAPSAARSDTLLPETAYALEEAGKARKSYLAYFKSLMGE
jgi:hypothetical protein